MIAFPDRAKKTRVGLEDTRKDLVMLLAGINRSSNVYHQLGPQAEDGTRCKHRHKRHCACKDTQH